MVSLVKKLLHLAVRDSTPDSEALAAIRALGKEVNKIGGIDNLFKEGVPKPPSHIPHSRKMQMIHDLENDVQIKNIRIIHLEAEVSRLIRENDRLQLDLTIAKKSSEKFVKTDISGIMSYEDFARQATTRLNDYRSWQINFERQTGISRNKMALWRQQGWVGPEAVEQLPFLRPVQIQPRYTGGWTIEEVNRLRRLINIGKSEKEIAETLSKEFGRFFTENSIKSIKTQSRARTGVFRNDAYGPPLGKSHGTK